MLSKMKSVESMITESENIASITQLNEKLSLLQKTADQIHSAIDNRVKILSNQLKEKYCEIAIERAHYQSQLKSIAKELNDAHQLCSNSLLIGCGFSVYTL